MRRTQVRLIAEMVTNDPDVFFEGLSDGPSGSGMGGSMSTSKPPQQTDVEDPMADKPMSALDISKEADEMGGNMEGADVVRDQMKQQQDMQKQQEMERQKVLEPQMQDLEQSMQKLNVGVMQGQQQATAGSEALSGLDKELTSVNTLLGGLQKQM